jgi:hypothetical protein
MTTITLTLTERMAQMLWTQACEFNAEMRLQSEEDGRWENLEVEVYNLAGGHAIDVQSEDWLGSTMYWCENTAEMFMLAAYEKAHGYKSQMLWDLADSGVLYQNGNPQPLGYTLLSSRPWDNQQHRPGTGSGKTQVKP